MNLSIDRLWNGQAAMAHEIVHMELRPGPTGVEVAVEAPFHGDPGPPAPPGVLDGLWEHEVVELFLLGDGDRYLEVELGPHGHHLVLELHGRRQPTRRGLPLEFEVGRDEAGRWSGLARLPWTYLPAGALRANAYAIHGVGAERRYLAWAPVPGDGPDFHRLEHFRPLSLSRP
jgi:hypothetical protein